MEEWMDELVGGGWMAEWMDGWVNGSVGRWMHGWMGTVQVHWQLFGILSVASVKQEFYFVLNISRSSPAATKRTVQESRPRSSPGSCQSLKCPNVLPEKKDTSGLLLQNLTSGIKGSVKDIL